LNLFLRPKIYAIVLCLSWTVAARATSYNNGITTDSLVVLIKNKAFSGDKMSFRDLGYLLDDISQRDKILKILDDLSFFPSKTIDFRQNISKAAFLDFFFKNQDKIHFSFLYKAYFINAAEREKVIFKTVAIEKKNIENKLSQSKAIIQNLELFIAAENADSAAVLLEKLRPLYSSEIFNFILKTSKDKRIVRSKVFKKTNFFKTLNEILGNYSNQESFDAILYLIDNELIAPSQSAFSLARITNVFAAHEGTDALLAKRYRQYADSLKSFEALRQFGYERYNHFQKNYFTDDVDYFGSLVGTAATEDSYWWIRENAMSDMIQTHHPRALYYCASQFYKEREKTAAFGFQSEYFLRTLHGWVNEKIEVQDGNNNFTDTPNDITSRKNFLTYWSQHWDDYEWDDFLRIFVNKQAKVAQKENYERLFRRLSSTNDSVAIQSFRELSEGEPSEIIKLAGKYRSLLRNVNPNLPNFKSKILENLTFLSNYCRQQNIPYNSTKKETALFSLLLGQISPSQRYLIENQLIKNLTIAQITAFEYWGILHEPNLAANYSCSRILDYWYSEHIQKILNDEKQLRLFLKKMSLFTRFSVVGTCNMYAKKLLFQDVKIKQKLQEIAKLESDADVLNLIQQLCNPLDKNEKINTPTTNTSGDNANIKNLISVLETSDLVDIESINSITQSPFYKEEYRDLCLKSLVKVANIEEIFLLKIQPKLSVKKGDLKYFRRISLSYKDLDDLPRVFETDDADKMFAFMSERASEFKIEEAGSFYNNIFRSAWFINYINGGLFTKQNTGVVKQILERYLSESELISEFEEQATQRNIVQLDNVGKPLLDKLATVKTSTLDDETRSKILNEIIARVHYEDLGLLVPFLNEMGDIGGRSSLTFLHEDFGLPIFEFSTAQASNEFVQNHAKLSELEFYKLYLEKFGLDITTKNKELNFEKIYNILKYDLVTPYISTGGSKRDIYVYGIIKVLELKFLTQLGFHYKLNESQTFYSYNSSKRVETWLKYMVENRIYKPDNEEVRSFNQ
jgi:hypothetical protein